MKRFKELTQFQMQKIKGGEDNPNIDPELAKKAKTAPKPKFKAGSDLADAVQ